ncbi:MAG TPA: hypothetical protein VM925_11120 [Labilithrix sp.]|nr:hypothetical protein [Labilithrix sp.]
MRALIATTIVALLVVACTEGADELSGGRGGGQNRMNNGALPGEEGAGAGGTTEGADPTQPGTCKEGVPHPGFANVDFVLDRRPGAIGVDRRRVKPYSALRSEFQRALGTVPTELASSAAAFGDVPARWYSEPTAGAVSLYTTYTLAFTGCYDSMTDAIYGQMPTAESASVECAKLQRKIWQRSPTPDETKACADHAVGLTDEPVARRRWAHACASIMASAGFTTY